MESLGDADTLEAQSKAILMENDIRDEEFTDEVEDFLITIPYSISVVYSGDQMFTTRKRSLDYP